MSSLTKQLTKNLQRKLQNPRPQSLNLTVMLWRIQISKDENSTQTTSETPSIRQSARSARRTMKQVEENMFRKGITIRDMYKIL
jgi:hypothetical protein